MKLSSVQAIIQALDQDGVRFLVAGGLAVNAHGFLRLTKDIDLVVQLTGPNIQAAYRALGRLGYRPMVPVTAEHLADATLRETLIRDKNMQVLQFWSDVHRETPVDIFASEPFPFDQEFAAATIKDLAGAGAVRFVSVPTLIRMKESTGREQDRIDVEHLRLRMGGP